MKVNLEGRYTSTYGFVGKNGLEKQAEKLFGKNWEAEDDLEQIQILCNCISNEQYVVSQIERDDYDIVVREVDNWELSKEHYDMILCACASDMYTLVRLEYFAWLDGGGGHQMYYDTICELVNEVMFSDNSPYLNWVKQWNGGKGKDFNDMYGNCLDWYHMDKVKKLFIDRYKDWYCEETKEEEVMEEVARLFLLVKSPKSTIKNAINYNIEKQYGIKNK